MRVERESDAQQPDNASAPSSSADPRQGAPATARVDAGCAAIRAIYAEDAALRQVAGPSDDQQAAKAMAKGGDVAENEQAVVWAHGEGEGRQLLVAKEEGQRQEEPAQQELNGADPYAQMSWDQTPQ